MSTALNKIQLKAARLLASGNSQKDVAIAVGVSLRTLQRWLKILEFRQAVSQAQGRVVEELGKAAAADVKKEIEKLLPKAFAVLDEVLSDADAKNNDRLRAAHILGGWAGLSQVSQQQPQQQPEENLKNYLEFLKQNAPSSAN